MWTDGGTSAEDKETTYSMICLNEDGTFGLPGTGLKAIEADDAALSFDGEYIHASMSDGTAVSVFAANGAKVAEYAFLNGVAKLNLPAGIYVATANGQAVKLVVR